MLHRRFDGLSEGCSDLVEPRLVEKVASKLGLTRRTEARGGGSGR